MADDGGMSSLLAAVEAAATSEAHTTTPAAIIPLSSTLPARPPDHPPNSNHFPTTSHNPTNTSAPITSHPRLAPLHPFSHPRSTAQHLHQPASTTSVPPPPPLPPPLPVPPPLPPMSIRRPTATPHPDPTHPTHPTNPIRTAQAPTVTVHEASSAPPPFSEKKRKGARIFTADEKKVLEANYARNKFPSRLHMQTLARAMGKGTEKVRTWYNNRRALDRKLGVDVIRNHVDDPRSPPPYSALGHPAEEPVILPSRVIASPPAQQVSPSNPIPGRTQAAVESTTDGGLVNVTPSTISWAPSVSPVTTERNGDFLTSSPTSHPNRFRMSPLRIRSGCLLIGQVEICGDLTENPAADRGLEVKFLFGKKRVVYEWYCGQNYAEAQCTGGPYAKMEMNFSSVHNMQLFKSATRSVLQLSFTAQPTLFIQTQESMDKYKVRAQQRQYRKVGVEEFPISVAADYHRIWMRTDEAVRVSRILIEDTPRLSTVFQTSNHDQGYRSKSGFSAPPFAPVAIKRDDIRISSAALANLSIPGSSSKSPGTSQARSIPMPMVDPSRGSMQGGAAGPRLGDMSPSATAPEKELRQPSCGNGDLPIVRPTTAAGAAANLLATPAPWHSPATPFVSSARPRREETAMHWLVGGAPPSVSATPLMERGGIQETPKNASTVRRELNFNNVHRLTGEPRTPRSPSRKRKASDITGDQNEGNESIRQRLTPRQARTPFQALQLGFPEPPFPPQLPVQSKIENCVAQEEEKRRVQVSRPDAASSIIHRLPR